MNAMYCEKTTNPSHSKQEGISVECQPPTCQQSVLRSDQVGPCMVRSKFNKFGHVQGPGLESCAEGGGARGCMGED